MWSTKFVFFCQAGKHLKQSRNFDSHSDQFHKDQNTQADCHCCFPCLIDIFLAITLWCLQLLSFTVASNAWYYYLYYYSNHHPTHHTTSYYQVFYYHHILIICVTHTTTSFYIPNIFSFPNEVVDQQKLRIIMLTKSFTSILFFTWTTYLLFKMPLKDNIKRLLKLFFSFLSFIGTIIL